MAGTKDKTKLAAEKARKQKIIVGIGGALLLAVLVIQGPKLWKQINPPAAEPASSSAASQAADATSTTATTTLATSKSTAVLAGVSISTAARSSRVVTGKLVGFTLFNAKDPFVPHVTTTSSSNTPSPDSASTPGSQPTSTTSSPAAQEPAGSDTTPTAAPPKPSFATIEVNGKAETVTLKGTFPAATPTFILVGLTHNGAKIGVAGGTIGGRKAIPVKMSKEITLVDSATQVRYTLKLVYAGSAPEKVETFNSGQPSDATSTTTP
jgi:hypothetical protein